MSYNRVVQNLENALETWNDKLSEIWQLITETPESFKGGTVWTVIVNSHGALRVKKSARILKMLVRFALAKRCCDIRT